MDNIIITKGLTKIYNKHKVVDNVDMHINKGEVYGFIGENGAGKTTVIRLLTGLIKPTHGSFSLFGAPSKSKEYDKAKEKVSAVVETPSLYLNMTAFENVRMQCILLGIKDKKIIDKILEMVGLTYMAHDKKTVNNYSLGMKQRLGIAMALVGDPEFIILDEPMNGLDPEGIVEIRNLIKKLNQDYQITFLISSHILDELSKVATKYGFIHQGKLVKEITADDLALQCQESLIMKVDNPEKAIETIYKLGYDKVDNIQNTIQVFGKVNINELVCHLTEVNIQIHEIRTNKETIENYYLKLMGGLRYE